MSTQMFHVKHRSVAPVSFIDPWSSEREQLPVLWRLSPALARLCFDQVFISEKRAWAHSDSNLPLVS